MENLCQLSTQKYNLNQNLGVQLELYDQTILVFVKKYGFCDLERSFGGTCMAEALASTDLGARVTDHLTSYQHYSDHLHVHLHSSDSWRRNTPKCTPYFP